MTTRHFWSQFSPSTSEELNSGDLPSHPFGSVLFFETESLMVVQVGLEVLILLSPGVGVTGVCHPHSGLMHSPLCSWGKAGPSLHFLSPS